jgi:hypothetical protein
VTIIGVSRRKPHRELQFRQLRPRREEAGSELFADQEEVKAGEKNRSTAANCERRGFESRMGNGLSVSSNARISAGRWRHG